MPEPRPTKDENRVGELRDLLERANRAYYTDSSPVMSDREFDKLLAELGELEASHPELDDPNSPTQRVGGDPIEGFETIEHALPMLSIDNTYSEADLGEWHARMIRLLGKGDDDSLFGGQDTDESNDISFCIDPKIDGVAISLRYERGELIRGVTRGDGRKGDDVTHAVRTIRSIPMRLFASGDNEIPGVLEVRGEAFIPDGEFVRINDRRDAEGLEAFMNPRNACAGTLKSLDPKVAASRRLGFIVHGRGQMEDGFADGHTQFIERARALGLPAGEHVQTCRTLDEILEAIRRFDGERHELPFATDGMVVRVDSYDAQSRLGVTSKSPRWAIAYKFPAEHKPTRLIGVEHQVGKTGKITPRAVMEAVLLSGTMVQHATLHNYGQIARKDIRVGDTIEVTKAGEIIPYVLGVVKGERPASAEPIEPPQACPVCEGPVEVEPPEATQSPQAETTRRCVNPECPAQVREKLVWFAGRTQMDIDGLGERTIDQIRATSLDPDDPARGELGVPPELRPIPLKHFADVFRLGERRADLLELERMGAKRMNKLLVGIENAKSRGLARVLAGMGIRHVGGTTARQLARLFPDLDALLDAPLWQLMPTAVNQMSKDRRAELTGSQAEIIDPPETGLGATTAPIVHAYLHSRAARITFNLLQRAGVSLVSVDFVDPNAVVGDRPLRGKTLVITGTLDRYTRAQLKEILEDMGARVAGSVSSETDILIAAKSAGSKLGKAQTLGVEIWNEEKTLGKIGLWGRRLGKNT